MNSNEILLSQESYELLKYIMSHPQFSIVENTSFSEDCLKQLRDYKLVQNVVTTYNELFNLVGEHFSITELGKGYLYGKQSNDNFQQSVKSIADSAVKTANKADVKGWISVFISLAAFIWSIVSSFTLQ